MTVRIKPLAFISLITFSLILATFSGLAGFFSSFFAVILPSLFIASIAHLILSWCKFAFNQRFSNDHPLKGEVVHFSLYAANESAIPAASGACHFADPGPMCDFKHEIPTPVGGNESATFEATIRCSYRGTYVIGLSSVSFRDATGIVEVRQNIEPRLFYVYPELIVPGIGAERLARSLGSDRPGSSRQEEDPSIFEYTTPLVPGRPARHVAWKRWAATGIPSEIIHGQSRSSALTVVLDLWPGYEGGIEKLASEDIAMSAAFSVIRHLARQGIPVELFYGNDENGIIISTEEQFQAVFDHTTNVIFDKPDFPSIAFASDRTALLVTTRPLVDYGKTMALDLFTAYEGALLKGAVPHVIACPPPAQADRERQAIDSLADLRVSLGVAGLLALADSRRGMEDLVNALAT
jgi:hypothetical protein